MPVVLATKAIDKSSYKVTSVFKDAAGSVITPNNAVWKLSNFDGVTVNSRTGTTETPSTEIAVLLQGNDIDASDGQGRIFTMEGDYDGDGSTAVPVKNECQFEIEDLSNA